jgi:putative CocE/NonD family hydrolase
VKNVANNNGNAGVFGISYPGFYATMAAVSGHPALKAVSPQAPVTDWFIGDDFHHNGAFALMDGFRFYYSFGQPRPQPSTRHGKAFNYHMKDAYQFYLKQGSLKNLTMYMDSIAFWKEMMNHPNYDNWWKARDARRACYDVKPAMLVVGGTFDAEDCFGAWNLYKAIEMQSPKTNNRLVMGPWFHGGWHRSNGSSLGNVRFGSNTSQYYQQNIEIPFFNYYLKGKGSSPQTEATIFFSGENNWKTFNTWPPKVTARPLYFGPYQHVSFEKPTQENSFSKYTSDPAKPVPYAEGVSPGRTREYMDDDQRFAARRPDVLVFESEAFDNDLTLAGSVIANLKVSLSTTDADFVIKIIDVFPNEFAYDTGYCCKGVKNEAEMAGYQMLVRAEIMRGKFRNSFEKPVAFIPGKVETVRFALPDVAHTFKKGHKLMVQVQSTWFPLFDRNPQQFTDIYKCGEEAFIPCEIKLCHSAKEASFLELPVLTDQ